ncbi:MAG: hypothetical protein LQ340_002413 [Diploschistes diacapsis]|nr:MAG: hypothetical protein LQ340_002413 [Diploschistes diacapsis]
MTTTIAFTDVELEIEHERNKPNTVEQVGRPVSVYSKAPSIRHTPANTIDRLRGGRAVLLGLQTTLVMLTNSFTTGLVTIGITEMAKDLSLDKSLVYWPVLAYTLTASPLLLPFGSAADVLGARAMSLAGCLGCGIFVLACGLVRNGSELIAFRCLQGAGAALFLPTSMSIISSGIEIGKLRNVTLASLALGQVLGYGLGLVGGGVLLSTVGWRAGYYICGAVQITLFVLGFWTIPSNPALTSKAAPSLILRRLWNEVDWVGSAISCASIGMLSYVLAAVAENSSSIKTPLNATLLTLSLLAIPCFAMWMNHQEKRGAPALIPNSLWNTTFSSICIMVTFSFAEMQAMELLASLFFGNVQELSPLQSSLRLLPGVVVATFATLSVGHFVHKLSIRWTLLALSIISSIAPLLMALANPVLPYWYEAFPAQVLYPLVVDSIFLVSALVISESFTERDQAVAGAVINTIANMGQSLGLAFIAVVTNSVTQSKSDMGSVEGLLEGYRAGFWAAFAWMLLNAVVGTLGLKKVGKVGIKRD